MFKSYLLKIFVLLSCLCCFEVGWCQYGRLNSFFYDKQGEPNNKLKELIIELQRGTSLEKLEVRKLISMKEVNGKQYYDLTDIYFYGFFIDAMRKKGYPDYEIFTDNFLEYHEGDYIVIKTLNLNSIDFTGSNLKGIKFYIDESESTKIRMRGCIFGSKTNLYYTKFVNVDLTDSKFEECYIGYTDFINSTIERVEFVDKTVSEGSKFQIVKMDSVTARDILFRGVNLSNIELKNTRFMNTGLEEIQFKRVTFNKVLISSCRLYRCTFIEPTFENSFKIKDSEIFYTKFEDIKEDQKKFFNISKDVYIDLFSTFNGESLSKYVYPESVFKKIGKFLWPILQAILVGFGIYMISRLIFKRVSGSASKE